MGKPEPIAAKIMVIRHAEKPADKGPPHGVSICGDHDHESLQVLGWQRAGALTCFFDPDQGPLQNPAIVTPRFLYASGIGHKSSSMRPQETITPLSEKTGVGINTSYLKSQHTKMVEDALTCAASVLICWEHKDIPSIANRILGNVTAPQDWPGYRFDVVWV